MGHHNDAGLSASGAIVPISSEVTTVSAGLKNEEVQALAYGPAVPLEGCEPPTWTSTGQALSMASLCLQGLIRPAALFLDDQVNEVQLGDHRRWQYEGVEIRLAHGAGQFVEHAGQFDPGVDE